MESVIFITLCFCKIAAKNQVHIANARINDPKAL